MSLSFRRGFLLCVCMYLLYIIKDLGILQVELSLKEATFTGSIFSSLCQEQASNVLEGLILRKWNTNCAAG